jgi:hypothetical protein
MAEPSLTTESPNLRNRWIRYVHTDEETGRDSIQVTQIVTVEVIYARPQSHRDLDHTDKAYVEWLMNQDGNGKIAQLNILTLSPQQVIDDDDPEVMINVPYSALGKPDKVVEFSLATVPEVLATINRLAEKHHDLVSRLVEHYGLVKLTDGTYTFPRRNG